MKTHRYLHQLLALGFACAGALTASATSYYVSTSGNDANNGTSTSTPWKTLAKVTAKTFAAGDTLNFNRGQTWTGTVKLNGSGTSASPIKVDAYGSGSLPIIAGAGAAGGTITLTNVQYWELNNLDVTNYAASRADNRQGIKVIASNSGARNHLYFSNIHCHDIAGATYNKDGGIIFSSEGATTASWFNDVKVQNCTFDDNLWMTGSQILSTWKTRSGGTGALNYPTTNFVFQSNTISTIADAAVTVRYASGALVQNNISSYNDNGINNTNAAGFWCAHSDSSKFQYNEAHHVYAPQGNDGMGFDSDVDNRSALFQYNYSHDNLGGFFAMYDDGSGSGNYATTFRYNVSQGDQKRTFEIKGKITSAAIYNNTIYTSATQTYVYDMGSWGDSGSSPQPASIASKNNIFYVRSTGTYRNVSANTTFDYNIFYNNHPASEPADAHKLTTDPKFASAGGAGNGISSAKTAYKLKTGSPALSSGVLISGNGGLDFWGNSVSSTAAPNRGAYNGAGT